MYKTLKKIIATFLLLFVGLSSQAQDTVMVNGVPKIYKKKKVEDYDASPLVKDDYLIDISYGYPFAPLQEAQMFGINFFSNTRTNKMIRNTNHLCARMDYQLNSEISVGLEFTYASMEFDYVRSQTIQSGSTTVITDSLFGAKATKIRFLAKLGYHFNISDRLDAYGTAGFGFKQFTYSSADYYLTTNNLVNEILPIAVRASIGGRFFLNKNMAIHVEGGIGGPMMQIGLTFKFHSSAAYN